MHYKKPRTNECRMLTQIKSGSSLRVEEVRLTCWATLDSVASTTLIREHKLSEDKWLLMSHRCTPISSRVQNTILLCNLKKIYISIYALLNFLVPQESSYFSKIYGLEKLPHLVLKTDFAAQNPVLGSIIIPLSEQLSP